MKKLKTLAAFSAIILYLLSVNNSFACACGCGMFDVATSSLIPNQKESLAFLQYDYVDQGKNLHGVKSAPEANNEDRKIKTQTTTLGLQTMFNRNWGFNVRVPYVNRKVKMVHEHMMEEELMKSNVNSLGDIRLNGIYSGFFDDMSTGITFGVKLPTGDYKAQDFHDRATQIGTGSTDLLLGAYHLGKLTDDGVMNYFLQGSLQKPVAIKDNYRIGDEANLSIGANYDFGRVGAFKKVAPILQLVATDKMRDRGINADADNSGYTRLMLVPGIEVDYDQFRFYADFGLPIYNNVNGNQLAATSIFKVIVGYKF
jgi:hypothetical protein